MTVGRVAAEVPAASSGREIRKESDIGHEDHPRLRQTELRAHTEAAEEVGISFIFLTHFNLKF
jgi:hypothetical protein